jgi:anti-sigma-K factor RskA
MSYRNRGSRARSRVTVVGAVGAIGFAVYYFLDPELGPQRRRVVIEAMEEAVAGAWRLSTELVARLVEPPAAPGPAAPTHAAPPGQPEVTVERRIVGPEPVPDLDATLHDEVSFFTVGEDSRLQEAVAVTVAPTRREPLRVADAVADERQGYAVAPPPEPRIIAYDAADSTRGYEPVPEAEEVYADEHDNRRGLLAIGLVAALLVAAAALGAWAVWGGDSSGTSSSSAAPGAAQAIELIGQPGARRVAVNGSNGQMVLVTTPNGRAVLILYGLKQAPAGKEYQAWIVTGKTPHSAGLFKGGGTTVVIPLAQRIPKKSVFAVTLERAGGVPAPTMSPQYTAKLT